MNTTIRMANVASYRDEVGLETNKPVNLIYGLNGAGKSTISNLLYEPTASEFSDCSISILPSAKVLVYNQRFIRENFYEADRLRGIFGLSKVNKEVDQKIAQGEIALDRLARDREEAEQQAKTQRAALARQSEKAAERTWEIRKNYSGGDRVLEFCVKGLMGKKETLFNHLLSISKPETRPERAIAQIKSDVESITGEASSKRALLPKCAFEGDPVESDEIFGQPIVGKEDSSVAGLIQKLNNSDWVRTGIQKYVSDPADGESTACPFCQELTLTDVLIEKIRGYFDESFTAAVSRISTLQAQYRSAIEHLPRVEIYDSMTLKEEQEARLRSAIEALRGRAKENLALIQAKLEKPSVAVQLKGTNDQIRTVNGLIDSINVEIGAHNARIENRNSELERLKSEFWSLMRWEYDQTISSWNAEQDETKAKLESQTAALARAEREIVETRKVVSELQKKTVNIDGAISSINEALEHFGIGDFSIVKHSDTHYRIVRPADAEAAFSSLSEGEKMIISFLYFCEICKGRQTAEETSERKVVVIDDPVSSLSHVFVFNIGQILKAEFFRSPLYSQIFVLTHSLYFFYELADSNHKRRSEEQQLFRISKSDRGSEIHNMKYEEIQNDYQSYWAVALDRTQHPAMVANCMRNIVEHFFGFVQKAPLNDVLQMQQLKGNRYQAFCRYMNRESHSDAKNLFDFKEFDYDAFRDGLKRLFDAAGYIEHYDKMEKCFGQ